ncbi:unnamed protein product [Staurois parvus]|uniref:Uncharacterized protein n=1 Tax=Staurois parvus TaxID=386267 RepID=A0ABN9EMT9_9NEOB|nr:unnamed protein product [Staurois parvus]
MPHTSAHQCTSMTHISAHQSCLLVPNINAIPISASQCHLSVLYMRPAFQCPSVMSVNAQQ